jgi:hypothetical protein
MLLTGSIGINLVIFIELPFRVSTPNDFTDASIWRVGCACKPRDRCVNGERHYCPRIACVPEGGDGDLATRRVVARRA